MLSKRERPACRVVRLAAAAFVASVLALPWLGCGQVNYSGDRRNPAEATTGASRVPSGVEIGEELLRSCGLETVWTQRAAEGTFRNVHVVADDLFVVEERRIRNDATSPRSYVLHCFDRADGLRRWMWDLKAPVKHAPWIHRYPRSGAATRDDELYLAQKDQVYCLDYKYGTTLWKANVPFSVSSGVVASDDHYFVGSADGKLFGIQKKKEIEDWFWFVDRGEVNTNGTVRGLFVYFTATNGKAYRFHVSRGMRDDRAWQFATGSAVRGAPGVYGPHVFVGSSDYKLYCLRDVDGSKAWEFQAQAPIHDTPVVVRYRPNLQVAFCISDDRRPAVNRRTLWAVNANDQTGGELLWRLEHVDKVVGVGKNAVYLLTDSRSGRGKTILGVDGTTGEERFAVPVDQFDFVPSSLSDQGPTRRQRALILLIHRNGFIQAIGEKL